MARRFNPPPGWPTPPPGWQPEPGWKPDPTWPPAPTGWRLWLDDHSLAPGPARGTSFGSGDRGKWGWVIAAMAGVMLVAGVAAQRGTETAANPPAGPLTEAGAAPSASRPSSAEVKKAAAAAQARAAAEAKARAAAEAKARAARAAARAKAAQAAAASKRAWAALSRAEGSTARFDHFQVSVITLRRVPAHTQVLARVCVRKLSDPSQDRTRISLDPWSITAGFNDLEPQSPPADLDHAFPAEATYRIGQCALGWLDFPTDQPALLITYANGVGEEAIWNVADVKAPPETRVTPWAPAPEE